MTAAMCEPAARPWACPDGQLMLRADAPRQQWLEVRSLGIGASDASAVLGLSRWTSPYEVWAEKRGYLPPTPDNDAMELGRLLEPVIADRWSATSGIPVRKAGLMASRERPWQLASVDRLAACGGLVEIKTLSHRVAQEWDDGQTPDHAEAQSQHQMAVTGRSHVHVVGLQDGRTWLERVVVRDDALIADLTKVEDEFWHEHVLAGVEPPVDGSVSTTETLNARWPGQLGAEVDGGEELARLREQKLAADEAVAAAEGELALVKNQIRALLGDATEGLVGDLEVATWRRNGVFSESALARNYPELHEQLLVPVTSMRVDVERLKREHPDAYAASRARVLRVTKNPKTRKKEQD
jgi:putative phage-type endonuclease